MITRLLVLIFYNVTITLCHDVRDGRIHMEGLWRAALDRIFYFPNHEKNFQNCAICKFCSKGHKTLSKHFPQHKNKNNYILSRTISAIYKGQMWQKPKMSESNIMSIRQPQWPERVRTTNQSPVVLMPPLDVPVPNKTNKASLENPAVCTYSVISCAKYQLSKILVGRMKQCIDIHLWREHFLLMLCMAWLWMNI